MNNEKLTYTQMKVLNQSIDNHFFDRETMRFFDSKIHGKCNYQGYFVSSEQQQNRLRKYTIRQFNFKTYEVKSISKFQEYNTLAKAKKTIKELK